MDRSKGPAVASLLAVATGAAIVGYLIWKRSNKKPVTEAGCATSEKKTVAASEKKTEPAKKPAKLLNKPTFSWEAVSRTKIVFNIAQKTLTFRNFGTIVSNTLSRGSRPSRRRRRAMRHVTRRPTRTSMGTSTTRSSPRPARAAPTGSSWTGASLPTFTRPTRTCAAATVCARTLPSCSSLRLPCTTAPWVR